jgi:DNA-binding CsgD family transcriptional regulator
VAEERGATSPDIGREIIDQEISHVKTYALPDWTCALPPPTVYSYHNIPNTTQRIAEGTRTARTSARVDGAKLILPESDASAIPLDTPAWFAWLEHRPLAAFPRTEERELRAEAAGSIHSVLGSQFSAVVEPLSARGLEVLRLIASGKSNAEVARTLVIAISTVKTHTNSIFSKLQVTSRTQAIALARDLQLL